MFRWAWNVHRNSINGKQKISYWGDSVYGACAMRGNDFDEN